MASGSGGGASRGTLPHIVNDSDGSSDSKQDDENNHPNDNRKQRQIQRTRTNQ